MDRLDTALTKRSQIWEFGSVFDEKVFLTCKGIINRLNVKMMTEMDDAVGKELSHWIMQRYGQKHLFQLDERNNFGTLITLLNGLMTPTTSAIPAEPLDDDEDDEESAERYYESYQVPEGDVLLNPVPYILEGKNRIQILGWYYEARGSIAKVGNYNGHYL